MERLMQKGVISWVGVFLIGFAALSLWPPAYDTIRVGVHVITRPILRIWHPEVLKKKVLSIPEDGKLAALARRMEFRIQQFQIQPDRTHDWLKEWKAQELEKRVFLTLLLRVLPENTARETPAPQKSNYLQTALNLTAEGRKSQPENGYYWFAESLVLFYSGQEEAAWLAFEQMNRSPQFEPGIHELNESEIHLWKSTNRMDELLPAAPRNWGYPIERSIQAYSRWLAIRQRSLLQKYNMEKALEATLAHLQLAHHLSGSGSSYADQALALSVWSRALQPYWTESKSIPETNVLEKNLLQYLDDQGDTTSGAKVRAWSVEIGNKERNLQQNLPIWRAVQRITAWNISSILGSLYLQCTSLIIVWLTLLVYQGNSPMTPISFRRTLLTTMVFLIPPLAWTFTHWPAGGNYLLVGIGLSWVLWLTLIRIFQSQVKMDQALQLSGYAVLTTLSATLAISLAAAVAYSHRSGLIFKLMSHPNY